MAHLDEYKLLSDRQHAFRKGHSCETQLTTVINDWAKILDNRGQVDMFILDFEKAFDTPPHELLKSKLFSYGIGGMTLKWIDSFLCFRQQRVELESVQKRAAKFMTGNYNDHETESMTGILGQLKWESLKKRRKDNRLILLFKSLKGKASEPTDDLIPETRRVEISTLWHFRLPLLIQIFIKVASFPGLSGIGMPSPIL